MTSFMRANAEKFGCFVCFDMCKRELNVANWPYAAITSRVEFGCVCVLLEAILIEETNKSYSWLCQNLFHMCPTRKADEYLTVACDGFFLLRQYNPWECPPQSLSQITGI